MTRGDDKEMNVFMEAAKVFVERERNRANRIIRVDTVQEAIKALDDIAPSSLTKVVFIGHGVEPDKAVGRLPDATKTEPLENRLRRHGPGFMFKGHRGANAHDFFFDKADNVLWASSEHPPSAEFLAKLAGKLALDARVYLQSCYGGEAGKTGTLVRRMADALSAGKSKRVKVAGYKGDLRYDDIVDPKTRRVLGYGSYIDGQEITPFKEIKGRLTNRPGIPPQDANE